MDRQGICCKIDNTVVKAEEVSAKNTGRVDTVGDMYQVVSWNAINIQRKDGSTSNIKGRRGDPN